MKAYDAYLDCTPHSQDTISDMSFDSSPKSAQSALYAVPQPPIEINSECGPTIGQSSLIPWSPVNTSSGTYLEAPHDRSRSPSHWFFSGTLGPANINGSRLNQLQNAQTLNWIDHGLFTGASSVDNLAFAMNQYRIDTPMSQPEVPELVSPTQYLFNPVSVPQSPYGIPRLASADHFQHETSTYHHHGLRPLDVVDPRAPLDHNEDIISDFDSRENTPASTAEPELTEREIDGRADSYAAIIFRILLKAPDHSMALADIYKVFKANGYKMKNRHDPCESGWKNSIRHNLSMNKGFEKVPAIGAESRGSSCVWRLSSTAIMNGIQSTTRYRHNKENHREKKALPPSAHHDARRRAGMAGGRQSRRGRLNHRPSPSNHHVEQMSLPSTPLLFSNPTFERAGGVTLPVFATSAPMTYLTGAGFAEVSSPSITDTSGPYTPSVSDESLLDAVTSFSPLVAWDAPVDVGAPSGTYLDDGGLLFQQAYDYDDDGCL